jgi:hypothetical protein
MSQKVVPISVFVSRKLSKLFVRQGFTSLFDVPVKIQNPAEPMGTHVFSVMEFQNESAVIRWTCIDPGEVFSQSRSSTKAAQRTGQTKYQTILPTPVSESLNY